MDWRLFVAYRYFTAGQKERFMSIISVISIMGVAVGVAALILVLAVMGGFNNELKSRIIGTTPHILVKAEAGISHPDPLLAKVLGESSEVTGYSPFVTGQVLLKKGERFGGAVASGIDESSEKYVTNIKQYVSGARPILAGRGMLIGSELANEMGIRVSDDVSLVSAAYNEPLFFKVKGIFKTGLYSFDASNIFIDLRSAQRLFGMGSMVSGMTVKIKDEFDADKVGADISRKLGFPYSVFSWMDLNRNLFSALVWEKLALSIVVTLIVIVAAFNIASSLIIRVTEKTRDIGILKAVGARKSDIGAIFRMEGLFIGGLGALAGACLGLLLGWAQKTYKIIRLPSDIYYLDAVPIHIDWYDPIIIAIAAILLSLAATVYPSRKASNLEVVDALRYE